MAYGTLFNTTNTTNALNVQVTLSLNKAECIIQLVARNWSYHTKVIVWFCVLYGK